MNDKDYLSRSKAKKKMKEIGGGLSWIISSNCISQNSDANELVDIEREITAAAYPAVLLGNDNVIPH